MKNCTPHCPFSCTVYAFEPGLSYKGIMTLLKGFDFLLKQSWPSPTPFIQRSAIKPVPPTSPVAALSCGSSDLFVAASNQTWLHIRLAGNCTLFLVERGH